MKYRLHINSYLCNQVERQFYGCKFWINFQSGFYHFDFDYQRNGHGVDRQNNRHDKNQFKAGKSFNFLGGFFYRCLSAEICRRDYNLGDVRADCRKCTEGANYASQCSEQLLFCHWLN